MMIYINREVLSKAINSRTGKVISKRLIAQYELVESKRENILEQVRLKNIAMRNQLRKLEREMRAREHLADGLHMIDFEQLKIENQSLGEKIEERGEELANLKRKKSNNVQLLSHVREKLVFVEKMNSKIRAELDVVEAQITQMRTDLGCAKRERETMRHENKVLTHKQGFSSNDLLIEDFDSTKYKLSDIRSSIRDLKNKYSVLASTLDMTVDSKTGLVNSPMRKSSSLSTLRINTGDFGMSTSHSSYAGALPPFHAGVATSPVHGGYGDSASSAGILFSPTNKQRLAPMRGSPSAHLAHMNMHTMPAIPVTVMTPLRHNSSTGAPFTRKLPPLSK
jgi:predicted  nucleic acid-binding Zn-ribbon protein